MLLSVVLVVTVVTTNSSLITSTSLKRLETLDIGAYSRENFYRANLGDEFYRIQQQANLGNEFDM